MAQSMDYEAEFSDGSFEMVDFEDFCYALSDSEEVLSETSKSQGNATESSDMDDEDDYGDFNDEDYPFDKLDTPSKSIANQDALYKFLEITANTKARKVVIADVVKEHVLPFLPAKSLARFRSVSKDWDHWISGPFLAHKQTYCFRDISGYFCQTTFGAPTFMSLNPSAFGIAGFYLNFLPEFVTVRSSCNGLVLCQGLGEERAYYICNPVNKQWQRIPQPNYYHGPGSSIILAFEPSELNFSADYHLICAVPLMDQPVLCFEIYSSQSKSWRRAGTDCIELGSTYLKEGGLYMKGFAYWETHCGKIVAFDFNSELFCGLLPRPQSSSPYGVLTNINGELCYVISDLQAGVGCFVDIYTGMDMSLMRRVVIDAGLVGVETGTCKALPFVNSDTVMVLVGKSVYSYHLRDAKVEVVSREGNDSTATYLPYVNSLVCVGPQ